MIRRLLAADATAFRDIRLEGLRAHPEAFGRSYMEESVLPLAHFLARIEMYKVFGAFLPDGTLGGVVGFSPREGEKYRHAGLIWGMYLRPQARGTGLARPLLKTAVEAGLAECSSLRLTVEANNLTAIGLYRRLGFTDWGLDRNALYVNGRYYDELSMRLDR